MGSIERSLEVARTHLDFFAFTGHSSWHDMPTMEGGRERHWIDGFRRLKETWPRVQQVIADGNRDRELCAFLGNLGGAGVRPFGQQARGPAGAGIAFKGARVDGLREMVQCGAEPGEGAERGTGHGAFLVPSPLGEKGLGMRGREFAV